MLLKKHINNIFIRNRGELLEIPESEQILCKVEFVEEIGEISGKVCYENPQRKIYESDGREVRLHWFAGKIYGAYYEMDENHIELKLAGKGKKEVEVDILFLELLALEKYLLRKEALVLHSSYVKWNGEGIAFTAPSGTGKSTQAELWRRYEGAEVINGDRSIILWNSKMQRFDISGLPFCGSSGINKDVCVPLKAIVFITQAKENCAEKYPVLQAVTRLFGEMSINQWNRGAVQKSLTIIERLSEAIPMVYMKCNMEQQAVETLKLFIGK